MDTKDGPRSKVEGRKKIEIRRPKLDKLIQIPGIEPRMEEPTEGRKKAEIRAPACDNSKTLMANPSDFGLRVSFGLRPSDFGLQMGLRPSGFHALVTSWLGRVKPQA